MSHFALCGDCLRRVECLCNTDSVCEERCHFCGGELCDCMECSEILGMLMRGVRGKIAGLIHPVLAWNPLDGWLR